MILLDADYKTENKKPVVRLFCKDNNRRPVIALDRSFKPYIYVIPKDIEKCKEKLEKFDVEEIKVIEKRDLGKKIKVLKVVFLHPQEVPKVRDKIRKLNEVKEIREYDIPFYRRYLIDNNLFPMSKIIAEGKEYKRGDVTFIELEKPPKVLKDVYHDYKILAFDIEVRNPKGMPRPEKDEIIMISIVGNSGIKKVISSEGSTLNFVEEVSNEKEILERFKEIVKSENPDIIIGYNSDNFDFPYIRDRARKLGIKLDLGVDGSEIKFVRRGFSTAAMIKGILHVDLYWVIRQYIRLDTYTLERVYYELFGEEKKLGIPGDELWKYWDSDEKRDELFKYSLDDAESTYKIAKKILPLILELTRIVGQPLSDIARMTTGQQVEWFLIRKAFERNELVPNKPSKAELEERKRRRPVGGYVKEPEKGLHEDLVQFDFKSLYPSIIISKNVSPDTLTNEDKKDVYVAPESGHKFLKKPKGFIPSIIGEILDERAEIKEKMKKTKDPLEKKILNVQQEALKRLANTMYGVYGYPNFRWYCIECAEAITAWGRKYIKETIKEAEKFGFHTVYADTDGFYATYKPKSRTNK
ncbi:replicative DNA polymerase I [Methanothermus fervidus DSM 2088]|uniref:DNA polymerase n=1 Tax=Methanothermus fervidus (strain ATCC 43054 / DSM 2088 / JCM 10308 / V24 S) TaxID=523846 RepID=E3GZH0_METFV|nr:DNA-directed DNA polymerase [Methanothermus fervidus]ADP77702.1 replicative DNA polymerase I [Methanothermus fervidus DSM 2088]